MPRYTTPTKQQLAWLRANLNRMSYTKMAEELGVCVDTLKRILVRHNIAHFESAKYAQSQRSTVKTWNRPCMNCGCTRTRPKWKYICSPCKEEMDWQEDD
jgi:IS30 family transposase